MNFKVSRFKVQTIQMKDIEQYLSVMLIVPNFGQDETKIVCTLTDVKGDVFKPRLGLQDKEGGVLFTMISKTLQCFKSTINISLPLTIVTPKIFCLAVHSLSVWRAITATVRKRIRTEIILFVLLNMCSVSPVNS